MFNDKAEVPLRVQRLFAQLPVCACVCGCHCALCHAPCTAAPRAMGFCVFLHAQRKNKNPKTTVKGKRINYAFQQSVEGEAHGEERERAGQSVAYKK